MDTYIVNKTAQPTGEHEVHKNDCGHLPENQNRQNLGYFKNCREAVKKAKESYYNVDGCYWCCNDCHTR